MTTFTRKAVAIVGVGAVLPDAPDAPTFWANVRAGRYSITEVPRDRWDPDAYWDPDPQAPDKTYSKIGGWVRDARWEPLKWRLPIPPRVSDAMDRPQKWAIMGAREALADFGYPERPLDPQRTAVILGNAMAGDRHYMTALRILFPEYAEELAAAPSFGKLEAAAQQAILAELKAGIGRRLPEINEDTMPGELANIIAGRVANIFDFHGPNYVADAACASAMAAISAAVEGLEAFDYDAVLTGGIDSNMSASTFTKFCKIGALSATGTRPYGAGADGFVMGEGAAVFLLKRLEDAERDGDAIYALIRGVGGSSDGKGKGITAPNPLGQRLAVERGWRNARRLPGPTTMIEGHGTSTRVGDVAEVESLNTAFKGLDLPPATIPLGSVKSNIGHLKGAAGAAGILKAAFALRDKVLPPSLGAEQLNPNIDFARSPFYVATELRPWETGNGEPRRVGTSAFGFGGTNFHTVLEEYVPGYAGSRGKTAVAVGAVPAAPAAPAVAVKAPPRGVLVLGAESQEALDERLRQTKAAAAEGRAPEPALPAAGDLRAPLRLAFDYGDAGELAGKVRRAAKARKSGRASAWAALRSQGIFRGEGPAGKVAFLYTGQGSQYVNMLADLRQIEPVVAETFAEADRVMTPLLGRPLSEIVFVDRGDKAAVAQAEEKLRQTEVTQPAVLTVDIALTRLLAAHGFVPDMVMGHSLGEYAALVTAGCLDFAQALEAVSARGQEMAKVSADDNGMMAAVSAPLEEIERTLAEIDGYVVVANLNSTRQAVIGGASAATEAAIEKFRQAGRDARPLTVSHAFHTAIVAPAGKQLVRMLRRFNLRPPSLPVISNVTGELYPRGRGDDETRELMIDLLGQQVASPVQFVKGLETLYAAGVRVFAEVGPKRALCSFAHDVFADSDDVHPLFTNHPRLGDVKSFNHALCGFYAAGVGVAREEVPELTTREPLPQAVASGPPPLRKEGLGEDFPRSGSPVATETAARKSPLSPPFFKGGRPEGAASGPSLSESQYRELGHLFAEFLERGYEIYGGRPGARGAPAAERPVVITGASLGLPGTERVFDDRNVARILAGEQLIDFIPNRHREAMVEKNITRLVKHDGNPRFETIASKADVIKLAARGGRLDLAAEFGYPEERLAALDVTTELAIGAGIDALRDAGIPLALHYKTTSKGTFLPERWQLPEALRDETGVIFASAFPGADYFAAETERYHADRARRRRLAELEDLRSRLDGGTSPLAAELDHRIATVKNEIEREPYTFDRRFLFRLLSMGHSQFAELIGARGPNTQVNSACASTAQAVALAEDWIRLGRCRRVVVISADDVTSDHLMEWIGAGFLASGAAATDDAVEDAALPFDRRRHGMLIGMGAAALVVESAEAAAERGLRPICEVLASETRNSAFHGTRLDVAHICDVMEALVAGAEARWGIARGEIARELVFVSHETYTPARGGSAQAEIHALRRVFGPAADRIVIANTKGFTGHPMGVGIEDVVAVKTLETGIVPPVPNLKEIDPELGELNLSRGGPYPVTCALRLAAGFGSQISLTLTRWVPSPGGARPTPDRLGYSARVADAGAWHGWLDRVSGYERAELEVERRTLRIQDQGAPTHAVAPAAVTAAAPPPVAEPVVSEPEPPVAAAPAALQPAPVARPAPVAQPAPAPQPTPAEAAPASEPAAGDPVRDKVLAIVAEKTGYPPDMLDLDLDLEADLGVDTVKQAETFAAIREAWDIPRDDNLKLQDYPTLAHTIEFVYSHRPDLPRPGAAPSPAAPAEPQAVESAPEAGEAPSGEPAKGDPVRDKVLAIVAEKTGYPPDMLDLDLDLEADLGVDTVKQAETFAAIRAAWDIPRDDNLKLQDYPTLAHAIEFVYAHRPDLRGGAAAAAAAPETGAEAEAEAATPATLAAESATTVPRRVPVPVLRPALELCKPTGVALESGRRVVVMLDDGGVGRALGGRLEKRGVEVLAVEGAPDAEALRAQLDEWLAAGPIHGVYWLPALDAEGDLAALDAAAWREALRRRLKLLYTAMRTLYEQIAGDGTFLVAATRLGGLHGHGDDGAFAPLGGAVTGFAKTFKRERPVALVKAVDFAPSRKTAALADLLIAETLADPGAVEVGYRDGERWTVGLVERPAAGDGLELGAGTVYVVTGAAGSIVSAIVADLAAAGGTFHLLDLAPEPDPADADLARFADDREGLKRDLFERLKARGERATPAKVEKELAALERRHAALAAVAAIRAAGGEAHYHQVDLLDAPAVGATVKEIRRRHERVDVLVHAAGLEISHLLPDKEPREFDLVFDVKADGFFHLLSALGETPLGAVVAFSSIAGRFGNAGQSDYSAANDLLCKLAASLRGRTRALAIDWTAWGGIGMATRGSIPQMMAQAGIDMLPPEAGIPVVRRELAAGASGELVVGQRLGVLLAEWDETGGLDPAKLPSEPRLLAGSVRGMGLNSGLVVETTLNPEEQPFLDDHRIDGTPVLPGVMGIEAFAEAAQLVAPGWHVAAVEDVAFLSPFKFYRGEPRAVTVEALPCRDGDDLAVECRLVGARRLAGQSEPQVTTHFTARVRLTRQPATVGERPWPGDEAEAAVGPDAIYRVYFHGPAYQVVQRAWSRNGSALGLLPESLPANHSPAEVSTVMAPRLIELCFQTAGLWELGRTGKLGLPWRVERVSRPRSSDPVQGRLCAVVEPDAANGGYSAYVVDEAGHVHVTLAGYSTIELPGGVAAEDLEALRTVMS